MSGVQGLFDAVGLIPELPDAACAGRWDLFDLAESGADPDDAQYKASVALKMCSWCPALARCEDWLESLPKSQRPLGVIAGRFNSPKSVGRPRRSA